MILFPSCIFMQVFGNKTLSGNDVVSIDLSGTLGILVCDAWGLLGDYCTKMLVIACVDYLPLSVFSL